MIPPTRVEVEKFANDAFAVAHLRIVNEYAAKQNEVLQNVRLRNNIGGYLPALIDWGAKRVRKTILAHAKAYVKAFKKAGIPSDAEAEKALGTSSLQIAAGTISHIRGQLDLLRARTRTPINNGIGAINREIEKFRLSALAEAKLKLEGQRIEAKAVAASRAIETLQRSTQGISTQSPVGKRKRGRPQTIPNERKFEAAKLKAAGGTNKQAAAVIYATKYPTNQQVKSVTTILRHFHRKSERSSSQSNRL